MEDKILGLFQQHPQLALLISIVVSIVVAVLGLVPSVFVTAANILFFGFWTGTLVSFLGEAIGAAVAFLLYRKGLKKATQHKLQKFPKLQRLVGAEGMEAFYLIFSLRLIPFVPSGLVTFAAAIGSVRFIIFLIGSSLGKLPALLMEAYSVYQVTSFGWQGKIILGLVALAILLMIIGKKKKRV